MPLAKFIVLFLFDFVFLLFFSLKTVGKKNFKKRLNIEKSRVFPSLWNTKNKATVKSNNNNNKKKKRESSAGVEPLTVETPVKYPNH